jgi:hypothetical protein
LPGTTGTQAAAAPNTATPAAAAPPAPAEQIAQVAGSIVIDTRGAGAVTLHLQPAELGAVSIRIGKTTDGGATVDVTVDRSATLQTLQADLGHLHQALDRAGVADNRTLTLHLGPSADQGGGSAAGGRNPAGDPSSGFAGNPGWQGSAGGQSGGAPGQNGQPRAQAAAAPPANGGQRDLGNATAAAAPASARNGRSAINITA